MYPFDVTRSGDRARPGDEFRVGGVIVGESA